MKIILESEDREKLIRLLPEEIQSFRDNILKNLEETCYVDDRVRDYVNILILDATLQHLEKKLNIIRD